MLLLNSYLVAWQKARKIYWGRYSSLPPPPPLKPPQNYLKNFQKLFSNTLSINRASHLKQYFPFFSARLSMLLRYKLALSSEQRQKSKHKLREKCPYSEFFWPVPSDHSGRIRRDDNYLLVLSPNAAICGPEKLRISTLFTQWHKT